MDYQNASIPYLFLKYDIREVGGHQPSESEGRVSFQARFYPSLSVVTPGRPVRLGEALCPRPALREALLPQWIAKR